MVAVDLDFGVTSGTPSTVAQTSGTSTPQPPILVEQKDKDRQPSSRRSLPEAKDRSRFYVHDRKDGKLIRFSEAMAAGRGLGRADPGGRPDGAAAANGGVEMVSDGVLGPKRPTSPMPSTDPARPYSRGDGVPRWEALAGRRLRPFPPKQQSGNVTAVDVNHRKFAWQAKTDNRDRRGISATGGDSRLTGEGNGRFRPYRCEDGREAVLWS